MPKEVVRPPEDRLTTILKLARKDGEEAAKEALARDSPELWVNSAWRRLRNQLAHNSDDDPSGLDEVAHAIPEEASPEQVSFEPYLFRMMALVLPRRLWEEELGDSLEVLHALRVSGAPGWQLRLKIFSTLIWCLVNALREVMSAVTGQAREREK